MKNYIKELYNKKKFEELFVGYSVSLIFIIEGMMQLTIYESLKIGFNSSLVFFALGVFSKFFAICLTYPYRVIQTILQSNREEFRNAVRFAMKNDGFAGFYNGFFACLARNLPPAGFLFLVLEVLRNVIKLALHTF